MAGLLKLRSTTAGAKRGRVVLHWGAHFPPTPTDINTAAQAAREAVGGGALSRTAAAR